jgi:hypothetical protein
MIILPSPPPFPSRQDDMPEYAKRIAEWQAETVRLLQAELNRIARFYNSADAPSLLPEATVADLTGNNPRFKPTRPVSGGCRMVYCTDETGGSIPAYSDGASWRRVTDGAVVS